MKCERCGEEIPAGDEMEHYGETLCEVCYMRALSPARACDPWAVRSAQNLSQLDDLSIRKFQKTPIDAPKGYVEISVGSRQARPAKQFSDRHDAYTALSETQTKILQVLAQTGGAAPEVVAQKLGISPLELEREFATLRHMEKVRGQMRDGKKIICLWEHESG